MRLEFAADGSVQVRTGKVELGQGIRTALAQIAADELGLVIERVQVLPADTAFGPDEGVTSGSLSVQDGGSALRAACIEARKQPPRGVPLVGSSVPRTDLAAKFAGAPSFIHDLAPPGLLHGRVLHPPRRDAQLAGVDLARVSSLPGVVAVARDGHLLGVLAERSRDADKAIGVLSAVARWEPGPPGPDESQARAGLTQQPATTSLVAERDSAPATASPAR